MSEYRTEKGESGQGHAPPLEPAFVRIVEALAVPALIWTGHLRNPLDEKAQPDLELAKYQITLLEILQAKTKGNLDKDEETFLANMLHTARLAYLRATEAEAQKKSAGESPGGDEKQTGEQKE